MESIITMGNHKDQLNNSLEEVDPQEPPDVGPGVRIYECMFCRRGFTTAQALGGHMNIHRKDRAKNRPSCYYLSNNSNKQEDHSFYANPKFCPQTYMSQTSNNQEGNIRYTTCFSSASSTAQPVNNENSHQGCHGVIKSPSREENMSLSLSFDWSDGEDHRVSKRRTRERSSEDELDLELRLGHNP